MKNIVLETIKKYNLISDGDKIVLGVSGGPDSISMLHILNEIKNNKIIEFEIVVAHINHMLREESTDDEKYVEKYCIENDIEFFAKRINIQEIATNNKIGTEEAGRNFRYEFFTEIMKKTNSNKIGIAHNKNDKIETIIMNFLRGSGVSGLKGIEPVRDNIYIRPLIECDREQIEEYCEQNNLQPRIDRTNFENEYTRNKIRNIVIPYIQQEFNPNIIETANRLSEVISEENDFMNRIAEDIYNKILVEQNKEQIVIKLKEFNKQENVIKNRLILLTIKQLTGSTQGIEKIHIRDIIKLCSNNIGNKFLTPNKKIKILIKDKKVYFIKL